MSCLNLKRLLPHRKMWKVLTTKLHLKLSRSKATKKPKHRSYKTSKKISWRSLSIQPKKFKKQNVIHHSHHCYAKRRPPPVFVDHLYVQPVSRVEEHVVTPRETSKEESASGSSSSKKRENPDLRSNEKIGRPASGKEGTGKIEDERIVNADDVWESMMLNSPQMNGIDERADEFIARFRAEMRQQEMQARRL